MYTFNLMISDNKAIFNLDLDIAYKAKEIDTYTGEYIFKPKYVEQTLETKDKVMNNNVLFKEITIHKTENKSGGYTVNIGEGV